MRRRLVAPFVVICALLAASTASAEPQTHVVAQGHTLGKIAKRYHVSVEALCEANKINRRDPLKLGQKLVIPEAGAKSTPSEGGEEPEVSEEPAPSEEPAAPAKKAATESKGSERNAEDDSSTRAFGNDGMRELAVPGHAPAYYYEPVGSGRKSMKPVVMYLHGRGGNPIRDCRRWAPVARRFGWLVCPSGPSAHGDGRDWNNNWVSGQQVAVAALGALRKQYGRRVQLLGNTLVGFSEGAYVALNVGVREARTFNRWLILAGNSSYWGGSGYEELKKHSRGVKRVYLITGEQDSVIEGTRQLSDWLEKAKVPTRMSAPQDLGHEVALERKPAMYRAALHWLDRGTGGAPGSKRASKTEKATAKR